MEGYYVLHKNITTPIMNDHSTPTLWEIDNSDRPYPNTMHNVTSQTPRTQEMPMRGHIAMNSGPSQILSQRQPEIALGLIFFIGLHRFFGYNHRPVFLPLMRSGIRSHTLPLGNRNWQSAFEARFREFSDHLRTASSPGDPYCLPGFLPSPPGDYDTLGP